MRKVEVLDPECGNGCVDERADNLSGGVFGFVFDFCGSGLESLFTVTNSSGDVRLKIVDDGFGVFDGFCGVTDDVIALFGEGVLGIIKLVEHVAWKNGTEVEGWVRGWETHLLLNMSSDP